MGNTNITNNTDIIIYLTYPRSEEGRLRSITEVINPGQTWSYQGPLTYLDIFCNNCNQLLAITSNNIPVKLFGLIQERPGLRILPTGDYIIYKIDTSNNIIR